MFELQMLRGLAEVVVWAVFVASIGGFLGFGIYLWWVSRA